ncbi:MAG: thymidine kinase [bacterium]|nr:thymidine kinase [bacterium]
MAKLYFRYGTMNSGKTIDIIKVAYNYYEMGMKTLVIKPAIDIKGNNNIVARNGLTRQADYLIKSKDNIYDLLKGKLSDIKCILVDESQFLLPQQVDELATIVDEYNIPIICYGLKTDFQSYLFSGSKRLLEVADSLEELKTICPCGKKALFNARLKEGEFVFTGEQVIIDGNAQYKALCRECYQEAERKAKTKTKKNTRN